VLRQETKLWSERFLPLLFDSYITDNTRRYRIKQSGEKYVGLFCSVPSFNLHEKEDIRSR
jgi:hypothetical protein